MFSFQLGVGVWRVRLAKEEPGSKEDVQAFLSLFSDSSNAHPSALQEDVPGNPRMGSSLALGVSVPLRRFARTANRPVVVRANSLRAISQKNGSAAR